MLRTVYWHPFGKLYLAISYNLAITMAWEDIASMHIKNDSWDDLASSLFARIKAIKDSVVELQCMRGLKATVVHAQYNVGCDYCLDVVTENSFWEQYLKLSQCQCLDIVGRKKKNCRFVLNQIFFLTQFLKTNFTLSKLPNTDL